MTGEQLDSGGQINLSDIFGALRRRIWLLLSVIVIILAGAGLIIYSLPLKYTATTTLMIDTRQQSVVDIDQVVSGLSPDSSTIDTQIRLLTSEELLQSVATSLDLMAESEFNPLLDAGDTWLVSGANWLGVGSDWLTASSGAVPGEVEDPEAIAARHLNAVVESLRDRLTVRQLGLSTVIEVNVTSLKPQLATTIANAIASTYIRGQVEAKLDATQQASDWLQSRLSQLRIDVLEAERAVEDYRAQTALVDQTSQDLQQDQIHRLGLDVLEAEIELGRARALLATIESSGNDPDFFDVLSTMEPAVAATVIGQWRVIAQLRADGRATTGLGNQSGVSSDDVFINQFTEAMRTYLNNRVSVAEQTLALVNERLAELQQQAVTLSLEMVDLRALEREAEASRTVLGLFLNRLRETEQIDFEQPDARIVSHATRPTEPSQPNRKLLIAVAALLGLMLGFAAVFMVETMDRRIRTQRELENITQVRSLGTLPWIRRASLKTLLKDLTDQPNTTLSNALRSLVLNVMKQRKEPGQAVVVLITSSLASEGKSTLAALLAAVASHTGLRAILIDGDARKGTLSRELIQAEDKAVHHSDAGDGPARLIPGFSGSSFNFIPSEPFVNERSNGIAPSAIGQIVKLLRPKNDLIVIDGAPILLVAETKALLSSVDGVLFLVRANATRRDDVEQALRELRLFDARIFGGVLTMDRDRTAARSYKYYYGAKT